MNFRTQFNLYATPPHECSYLSGRQATTIFIDPHFPKDKALYSTLSQHGFRRSGEHLYRPHCHSCDACVPVRIPVCFFEPNRTQQRIWRKNQDLVVKAVAGGFREEHFQLYSRYLAARHAGGGMDNPTRHSYMQFLTSSWAETIFYEFYLQDELIIVAVVDHFEQGLSAVYTFFNPDYPKRSLGVYAVLWEIEECKRLRKEALYLGYWIKNCQKMSYKVNYQPLEYYRHGLWQPKP
ncbi:putative arginyl-tRNA:protein arginylyltransferase [Beggiatoa alba B18LD]|uniref:Aspartate/glutamate leucyltransferase n=2 Tax=Beggiatoa alba TaxID=1022 RepID=I3CGM5_9GAMM|nr:putative arginyl-tRNA:protein arginylyltransferase [Beggiatoa alba B18LD]